MWAGGGEEEGRRGGRGREGGGGREGGSERVGRGGESRRKEP